jgi:hypothetical protein
VLTQDALGQRSRTDALAPAAGGSWVIRTSLISAAEQPQFCTIRAHRSAACVVDRLDEEPATLVLAMEHGASVVQVATAPDRTVAGAAAQCVRVLVSVPDGPERGERCSFGDGALAYSTSPVAGQQLLLLSRSPAIDTARLTKGSS